MKKASKILFLIGGILCIFIALAWVACAGVAFVHFGLVVAIRQGANPADLMANEVAKPFMENIDKIIAENGYTGGYLDEGLFQALLKVCVFFVCLFVFAIPAAILSFICKGKDKPSLGLLIVATVFNISCGSVVSVVGGVLGIVNWAVNGRKE